MLCGHGDDIHQYPDIRINFSSNIYAHADMSTLKEHLRRCMDLIDNYPEPTPCSLERVIAEKHGIGSDCVLVTNGITDAIYLIAETMARTAAATYAIAARPTFSEYEDACRLYGIPEATAGKASLLWLCNPNNPTGQVLAPHEVRHLARRQAYVVVDQSYEDYTLAPMLTHQEAASADSNIITLHSMTKTYAVPGLRIGYVVAAPAIVDRLRRRVRPWAVNALAIEAGKWLVEHDAKAVGDLPAYLAETARLRQQLNAIPGISAQDTHTNFMLARIDHLTAAELKARLARRHHILIRDASNFATLTPHHFRIATQTATENDQLIAALRTLGKVPEGMTSL